MKSVTFVLTLTILTLCLSPTLQNEESLSSAEYHDLVPLYILYPNFLTTSMREVTQYLTKNGFQQKATLGFVATNSYDCNGIDNLIPIYRFHNKITEQHMLSTNANPPNETTVPYTPDGIAFYASASTSSNECGPTVPLHRYWVHTRYDYTTDKKNADAVLVEMEGGRYSGIVCHIWVTDNCYTPVPTTPVPTTPVPTTPVPTTQVPTTPVPTTPVPTTTTRTKTVPTTTTRATTVPTTTTRTTTVPTTTTRTTTVPTTTTRTTTVPTTTAAPYCPVNPVPLWRLYRPISNNHFYTTSEPEAQNAVWAYRYVREGSPGNVAKSASDCSCENNFVAVYRLYKPGQFDDHFYTASENEANQAQSAYGYNRESIEYYCSPIKDHCGATIPLHRYWRGTDHFYTNSIGEGNSNVIPYGGVYEGIVCYIWP